MKYVRKEYNILTDTFEDAVVHYDFCKTIMFNKHDGERIMVRITKVIFNPPATIILWSDGTKTVVKCKEGDTFDKETGLAMAICKRIFSRSEFKKWCKEE